MTKKVEQLLQKGEGISIEFKKAFNELPKTLFDTVVAFLNRNGGEILLGISDNKSVTGVNENIAEQLSKQISNLSNNPQVLFPTFLINANIVTYKGKTLIHIYIPVSSQVHKYKGKIYDRGSDGDFELKSDEQIKQMYQNTLKILSIRFYNKTILPKELLTEYEKSYGYIAPITHGMN